MKKLRQILIILLLSNNGYSQDYPSFEEIEKLVSDSAQSTYYPKLIERFVSFDPTLSSGEYILIYYGFGFQENYNGYRQEPSHMYYSLFENKEYGKIIEKCDSVLKTVPVCLASNSYKGQALKLLYPDSSVYKLYFERYINLMDVLLKSGDGKSINTAYKILFLSDKRRIMYGVLELGRYTKQALINHYDELTVKKSKKFDKKKIYFDVLLPLTGTMREFRKEKK